MIRTFKPDPSNPAKPKRRRLRTVAMLPTLLTLGNLYFGFTAAYCCGRELEDLGAQINASEKRTLNSVFFEAKAPSYLAIATWMLFGSMLCDGLDGRVARKTGASSTFGMQLDSLSDVVSFGVAPAMMMVVLTRREILQAGYPPFGFEGFEKLALFIAAIYVCCAALRLARFNVEATLDESGHQGFKGLPSPGAAIGVISLIFLHEHLDITSNYHHTAAMIARVLPFATLATALLMVSRVGYTHVVSSFFRRRPFAHIVGVLLAIPLVWMFTELAVMIGAWIFVLSGPVSMLWAKPPVPADVPTAGTLEETHEPPKAHRLP
jgi:CDP-diacylglycerol---serine O-phosphatidyltransferase